MKVHFGRKLIGFIFISLVLVFGLTLSFLSTDNENAHAATISATCTNTATDSATLNAAIASSPVGSQILITGPCELTSPITLLGDRTYTGGNTTGTTLTQAPGANLPYLLASDSYVSNWTYTGDPLAVRDLTINCSSSNNTAATNGLVIRSWMSDVEHLYVTGCKGSGIVDTNTSANGTALTDTSVNTRIDNNYVENSGVYGIDIHDTGNSVTDGYLEDNQVAVSSADGIHLDNAAGWSITGNHLWSNGNDAIYANRMFSSTISNNYIEDFGDAAGNGAIWYGIDVTAQGGVPSTISGNKVTNFNPTVKGTKYDYIAVTQVNYGTSYLDVTGNSIVGDSGSGETGFYFTAGSKVYLNLTSMGNSVSLVNTTRTLGAGVTLSSGI